MGQPVILFFTPGEYPDGSTLCENGPTYDRLRDLVVQLDSFDVQILVFVTWPESPACDAVHVDDVALPLIEHDMELIRAFRPGVDWLIVIGRDGTVVGVDELRADYDSEGRVIGTDIVRLYIGQVFDLLMDEE